MQPRLRIMFFPQKPLLLPRIRPGQLSNQRPNSLELSAQKLKSKSPGTESLPHVLVGSPYTDIPEHNGPGAVPAGWNRPFESAIPDRMILDQDRQSIPSRIKAWAARDRPTFENTSMLQSKVIMQTCCMVLLNNKTQKLARGLFEEQFLARVRQFHLSSSRSAAEF